MRRISYIMGWRRKDKFMYSDDYWDALEGAVSGTFLAAVSGVMLYCAFPPASVWLLAYIALVPMMWAHLRSYPDRLSWLAPTVTTLVFLGLHFNKLSTGVTLGRDRLPFLVEYLFENKARAIVVVSAVVGLVSVFRREFHRQTGFRFLVLEPALFWMALDYLRDSVPVIGTSASFGYSQFALPGIARIAGTFGFLGVTGLVVVANAGLTTFFLTRFGDERGYLWLGHPPPDIQRRLLTQGRWAFFAVAALIGFGTYVAPLAMKPASYVTVGVAQRGPTYTYVYDHNLGTLRKLTSTAAESGAQIVVWPEASFRDEPRTQDYWPEIQSIACDSGCYLVVPFYAEAVADADLYPDMGDVQEPEASWETDAFFDWTTDVDELAPRYVNEALLVSPDGEVAGVAAKDHPLSFLGETSVTRGGYPVFDTTFGKVGIMICYDLNFTNTALNLARNGAEILCVPSNDWREISQAQYAYGVFRAVETGASLVKADTAHDSCIVAFDGRILAKSVSYYGEQSMLVASVPLRGRVPLFLSVGNCLGLVSLIAWVAGLTALPAVYSRKKELRIPTSSS